MLVKQVPWVLSVSIFLMMVIHFQFSIGTNQPFYSLKSFFDQTRDLLCIAGGFDGYFKK
jgi:hypothetical protein